MTTLSEKFDALETQLATQAATTDGYIDTVEAKLQAIFDELDTILINNAQNTRYLLAALGANSPCAPCPTPSLTVPVTNPTTRPVNFDKCKRTQAFLHAMAEVFTVLDTMSAFSIPFSPSLISDAISQVITALANGDTTPLPSFPESVQLVGDGINYVAGNFTVGNTLSELFAAQVFDLRAAIYAAGNAAADQVAYNGVIDASDIPSYAKPLIKDAAYNELYSYYFDPASMPNLTGYSGTICAGADCIVIASQSVHYSGGQDFQTIVWPEPFTATEVFDGGPSESAAIFCLDNLVGWTMTADLNVRVHNAYQDSPDDLNVGNTHTFASGIGAWVYNPASSASFSITICPPA